MAEILSQDEIDALISQLSSSGLMETADSGPVKSRETIRAYDFKRPDKFSRDQLRTLQFLHENFSRLMTNYLSATFRSIFHVDVESVDQMTYGEFMALLVEPAIVGVVDFAPMDGRVVLAVDPMIAFPIIDRLLGGPGETVPENLRGLTDIELTIMTRIMEKMLPYLTEAWHNICSLEPTLDRIETNPLFAQEVAPSDMSVVITFNVQLGSKKGTMYLCIPYIVIEPIVPRLSAHRWFSGEPKPMDEKEGLTLEKRVKAAAVPVVVELGRCEVSVREILELSPGDVVSLDKRLDEPLEVRVGDKVKFLASPGRVGKKLGFVVRSVKMEEEDKLG